MSRLIIVPQYPTKMRYQEWWWDEFPKELHWNFSEIIVIDGWRKKEDLNALVSKDIFSPVEAAINLEFYQISQYLNLQLKPDDILLLNDLSFPGMFANVLFHKRPSKCFAICHATSKNRYDYFAKVRSSKYGTEKGISKLFDKVFVATEYHKQKLGWKNLEVVGLPYPRFQEYAIPKQILISVAGRNSLQKRNKRLEKEIARNFNTKINEMDYPTWESYLRAMSASKFLLITSKEETFGYQVMDAILCGTIPLAPNAYSYPELLPQEYLYNNVEELKQLINWYARIFTNEYNIPKLLMEDTCKKFYSNVANIMKE